MSKTYLAEYGSSNSCLSSYIDCSGFILSASKVSANKKENGGGVKT
jgi:hypothetical protein